LIETPTTTFAECPRDLAVLFIGGGMGESIELMDDAQVLGFLGGRRSREKYVTSVCSGLLVVGAAGLLNGY
jgi:cyclohexyl-isocyanide hydratase